jgi:hypothetical protein
MDLEHISPFLCVDIGFCIATAKTPLGKNRSVVSHVAHPEQIVYIHRHGNPGSYMTVSFEDT